MANEARAGLAKARGQGKNDLRRWMTRTQGVDTEERG
jgi:hypothetical protein